MIERVRDVEDALAQAKSDHQSAVVEVARLTERESSLSARLASEAADLAESEAAREAVERELAAVIKDAIARRAELDDQIRQERASRADLERELTEAEAAWGGSQQQYEAALADAAHLLADHRTRSDRELTQAAADRDRLSERVREVEGVLAQVRTDHQSATEEIARLSQLEIVLSAQLAGVSARLAETEAARRTAESRLAEAITNATARVRELEGTLATTEQQAAQAVRAHDEANDRATRDRADASAVQADLAARLTRETETRQTLERTVAETRAAAVDAERAFQEQAESLRADAREQQERFDAQLKEARTDHQKQQGELQAGNAALARERDGLLQSLAAAQEQSRQLDAELREGRVRLDEVEEAADADRRQLTAGLAESERRLGETRTEIQQLQERLAATVSNLDGTTARLNAVQAQAESVPRLRRELEESRAESGRLFQQAGLAMFRCTRNGEVTQANRAAMTLVGRRTIDELRGAQFSAGVFEDPKALSWLIDLCLSTRTRESIEATWRRKDGGRLFVRLSAYACAPEVIEILAEDLTRVRVLQERLGQAHRIEAVGRLASEVAATCGSLLNDVHQQAQEWLVSAGASAGSRQQGQQLLADVTRAAGLLGQLRAYEEEQSRNPTPADLNTVIHDLEPVLKRLAGDAVDVQLPGGASRLNVDVSTERVERLLVNLASYGRARMPFGGQLKIELGTTVVDRRFAAKHPNVRLGPHALITVTETKSSRRADGASSSDSTDQKPGVDFGTLHGLVGGCGGHLWMTVQPQGDMIAKIRLPLLAFQDDAAPRKLIARGGRALTRLFHLELPGRSADLQVRYDFTRMLLMITGSAGTSPGWVLTPSILSTTFMPDVTLPNTA